MGYERQIIFLSCIILIHLIVPTITNAQPNFQAHYCNYDYTGNYTNNSAYRTNLDTLPSFLSSNTHFFNFSIGQNPDLVNVIGLCRGDVTGDACFSCLNDSNTKLREICPQEKQSIGWYDNCMLRYSDLPIFHVINTFPNAYTYNPQPVSVPNRFNRAVRSLLSSLVDVAAGGSSVRKFATGNTMGQDNLAVYGLAECTPDLTGPQCRECLNGTADVLPECCDGRIGGRVLRPSCSFRYEIGRFYRQTTGNAPPLADETPSSDAPPTVDVPPPPRTPVTGEDDNTIRTVIIIIISTVSFVIIVIVIIFILKRKRKQRKLKPKDESETTDEVSTVESLQYDFDIIRAATDDFSDTNKLGQGGFGVVYKGRLQNGREVAVKRLSRNSGQGEPEFKNEVLLMANLQHRNLVRLIGFCLKGTERLLIYEFVPNSSLDRFIFDPEKSAYLDAHMRCKIIGGIARGLLYLHEDSQVRIIHRDLKASNILLDAEMNPKISDFGMARMFEFDDTQGCTERIVGTYGYMAPEYAMLGQFSVKSDVYSFGVLVLEILSGQKNTTGFKNEENIEYLLSNAWKNWLEGTHSKFIDPALKDGSCSIRDIMRCIHIGLLCVQEKVVSRPTMASVVLMLSSFSLTLPLPSEPAFFKIDPQEEQVGDHIGANEFSPPETKNIKISINEASITELSGR